VSRPFVLVIVKILSDAINPSVYPVLYRFNPATACWQKLRNASFSVREVHCYLRQGQVTIWPWSRDNLRSRDSTSEVVLKRTASVPATIPAHHRIFHSMSATLHGTFDGEKTKCLEEAISQCERLIVEREAAKAEFDALKTQYAENKEFLEALYVDNVCSQSAFLFS